MCLRISIILLVLLTSGAALGYRKGEPYHFSHDLSSAAIERTSHSVRYDGKYGAISYSNGDVPDDVGVCTDVVIRAYRKLGVDLQLDVHQEMKSHS